MQVLYPNSSASLLTLKPTVDSIMALEAVNTERD